MAVGTPRTPRVRFLGALLDCYANEEWRIASWRRAFGEGRKGEGQGEAGKEGERRKGVAPRGRWYVSPFSKFFNRRRAIVLRFFIGQVDKVHGIM